MTPLEQKFRGGGGGGLIERTIDPWEGYGYFLESHIRVKHFVGLKAHLQ